MADARLKRDRHPMIEKHAFRGSPDDGDVVIILLSYRHTISVRSRLLICCYASSHDWRLCVWLDASWSEWREEVRACEVIEFRLTEHRLLRRSIDHAHVLELLSKQISALHHSKHQPRDWKPFLHLPMDLGKRLCKVI